MKEIEIIIGYECNNNCLFCSNQYLKQMAKKQGIKVDSEKIIERIPDNKGKDVNRLVFVGGEPTVVNDFFGIIKAAKGKGNRRISIMSNGRMLGNMSFCRKLLDEGIIDIGISIHGHNAKIHDSLTRSPGSFRQTVQGMRNLNKLGRNFVTNTVINKKNYKILPELVAFLTEYRPDLVLLTFPNPRGNAEKYFDEIVPAYSEAMPYVFKALALGKRIGQNVRTSEIPFCLMRGYEKNMQEPFFGKERRIITHVFDDILYTPYSGRDKSKFEYCKACGYNAVCEGIWTNYIKLRGFKEFVSLNREKR